MTIGRRAAVVLPLMVFLAVAALISGSAWGAPGAAEPLTELVSGDGDGAGGDGNSLAPSISADGRYVAFISRAKNLSAAAKSGRQEVYVRDMNAGTTTLVSRAGGVDGAVAEYDSYTPSISADGRYVAFSSAAESLSPDDAAIGDVFVRDLATATTTLVSRASGLAGAAADDESFEPSISADGRHVAFASRADNLSSEGAGAGSADIFVRDLDSGVTELISRASGVTGAAASESYAPSISGDGRYVAFSSPSALSPEDFDQPSFPMDVFVRDRSAAATILVSRKSGATGAPGDVQSETPAISADGHHVAFTSDAKLTGQRGYDRNVFVRDLVAGTTKLASVGDEGRAGDAKRTPSISADGRYVAFQTGGNELSPVDADGRVDVFVRDMQKGLTVTVSRASGRLGVPADAAAFDASVSADGSHVAFDSRATNLSAADADPFTDVFLRRVVYAKEPQLPRCAGRIATVIGGSGRDVLKGTERKDVIVALGGDDRIASFAGADVICAGAGKDVVDAGSNGRGGGSDLVLGGPGADRLALGPELGTLKGEGGNDLLLGSKGGDSLFGGPGNDVLRGGPNPVFNSDFLSGGPGNDALFGGPGSNQLEGGPGRDREVGDNR
jgi:Tol biopolymer transport system component